MPFYIDSHCLEGLKAFAVSEGMEKFRGEQIYKWIHHSGCEDIAGMTNLSNAIREKLTEKAKFTVMEPVKVQKSAQDGSVKVLFRLEDGEHIESVILSDGTRMTACISSQVGCRMGCAFCSTAIMGLKRNLTVGEILKQVKRLNDILAETDDRLNNIVFMGMGEPLDNIDNVMEAITVLLDDNGYGFSHKKITLSTCGVAENIEKLFKIKTPVNLAVSINASTQEQRKSIMPISAKYPLSDLMKVLKNLPLQKRKSITIEYVLLKGINDSMKDADNLVKLLKGLDKVKVNLILYNSGADEKYQAPEEKDALKFQQYLINNRIGVFIRKSLGSDIDGACGQLRARHEKNL
ncbi:MAG: 23S rRNA (adenine(2503)-C(2))-methyltransferase RlmN [Deferribacterales bacterium]